MLVGRLVAIGFVGLVVACAHATACDGSADCVPSAPAVISAGGEVVLAPGQTVAIENTGVRITFDGIVSDSRCPRDVVCVWAGNALARLRVTADGANPRTVELNSMLDPRVANASGHTLRFVGLAPDAVSTSKIDPGAYRLTIRVDRP